MKYSNSMFYSAGCGNVKACIRSQLQLKGPTGLRRVGKTTLMLKIVEDAIRKGFSSRDIVYFSFDEFRESQIREVLNQHETLMDRDLSSGKYLVLLDEIQKTKVGKIS
jgi:predicted AAA+ superfamily ATPase